ncbi:type II toxin-antitoxin system RelE/ParE family toxin [Caulobacter mirabilis]|uniref:Addiction module toxin RelE n=1 Tax=Caulobacter mirabilis TaxID=69666 RepID=A0A2D2B1C9_9CAUL|nr:type II toxin-antitoxin system RelE/ParE family toxin [Caulobacter mirabilis]ATQ44074.1 addiction module toxin RelE [Caulobacter mirabilis]
MATVTWTIQALQDLKEVRAFIAQERPITAERIGDRLRAAAAKLDQHPNRGRPIAGGRRELSHIAPYLIRYRVEAEQIVVLEVRHAAREAE